MDDKTQAGIESIRSGNAEIGRGLLLQALERSRPSFEALFWLASAERKLGNLPEAERLGREAIRINPSELHGHMSLGFTYLELGQGFKAGQSFQSALDLAPENALAAHFLGIARIAANDYSGAEEALRTAAKLAPGSVESWLSLSGLLRDQGKDEQALRCARKAWSISQTERTTLSLAERLINNDRFSEAKDFLTTLLSASGDSVARGHALLGQCLQAMGQTGQAEVSFRKSIELDPNQGFALYSLVQSSSSNAHLVDHIRDLVAFEHPDETKAYLHFALGKALEDSGEFAESMRNYDEGNKIALRIYHPNPFSPADYRTRVNLLLNTNRAPDRNPVRDETPILIVGMMRSGTTLLEQILSSHPQIEGAGEVRFWSDHFSRAVATGDELSGLAEEYIAKLRKNSKEATRIIDKMPGNYAFLGEISRVLPNARFIHVRRNPIDTCLSIYCMGMSFRVPFAHSKANIVFAYRQYQRLMEHWRDVFSPERFIEVSYEDLVRNREKESRRLVDFCGVAWDDACLEPHNNKRIVATPSSWQVRRSVYDTSIDRWRKFEPWLGELCNLKT